ncbi:hypothetical protein DFP72DRAFT_860581 [Ephemerocybe angulata]|uniref:Uncharacterized protein n=1 Tax=Ephemerocybe angulata TaxID=980116 RepID=A0A8H6HAT2_9AGAR|nr:hypothetical protein DFP72DRAFT_860581 [Tulosesus angulatus]
MLTTCGFKEDKLNEWTAILYFKHDNGTYIHIPPKANHWAGETNGGFTVNNIVSLFTTSSLILVYNIRHGDSPLFLYLHEWPKGPRWNSPATELPQAEGARVYEECE